MHYVGQIVGYVPVDCEFPSVPVEPQRWYPLAVTPGRDGKVMKEFERLGYSGWSPGIVKFINRSTSDPARRPHLGRRTVRPFLPGLILLPDFELPNLGAIRCIHDVDNIVDLGGTLRKWLNVTEMNLLRDLVVIENMLPSRRRGALMQLFVKYGFITVAQIVEEPTMVGRKIRVVDGLFAGLLGLIERVDSHSRLSVYVEAGKRGVKVNGLTETQIELID